MSSVSSHSIMTGYCFTGLRGCGTLLFLSVLLVAAQSAPLNCTHQHCTEQGLPLNANDAHVSNKIMKLALEELLPKTEAPHQNVSWQSIIAAHQAFCLFLERLAFSMGNISLKPQNLSFIIVHLIHQRFYLICDPTVPSSADR